MITWGGLKPEFMRMQILKDLDQQPNLRSWMHYQLFGIFWKMVFYSDIAKWRLVSPDSLVAQ